MIQMSCGKVNRNARLTTPQRRIICRKKILCPTNTGQNSQKQGHDKGDGYVRGLRLGSDLRGPYSRRQHDSFFKTRQETKHKQELSRLERQAEEIFGTINNLQRAKTLGASVFSYIFGCIAALLLGGGMSLIMLNQNNFAAFVGGIALGIAGIALCCVNYFIYKKWSKRKPENCCRSSTTTKKSLPIFSKRQRPA